MSREKIQFRKKNGTLGTGHNFVSAVGYKRASMFSRGGREGRETKPGKTSASPKKKKTPEKKKKQNLKKKKKRKRKNKEKKKKKKKKKQQFSKTFQKKHNKKLLFQKKSHLALFKIFIRSSLLRGFIFSLLGRKRDIVDILSGILL